MSKETSLYGKPKPNTFHTAFTIKGPKEEYNHYRIPPDFDKCHQHFKANRVYKFVQKKNGEVDQREKCPCCGHPIDNELLALGCSTKELAHLGASYPLFFETIKFSWIMLFLIFAIMGLYGIITNQIADDCNHTRWKGDGDYVTANYTTDSNVAVIINNCEDSFINTYSLGNKRYHDYKKGVQAWLVLGSSVAMIIACQFFRWHARRTVETVNFELCTPSDYTVSIQYFPKKTTQAQIRQYVEDKVEAINKTAKPESQLEIKKIILGYDTNYYLQLKAKLSKLAYEHHVANPNRKDKLYNEMQAIHVEMKRMEDSENSRSFTGVCYVVFNRPSEPKKFLSKYRVGRVKKFLHVIGLGKFVTISSSYTVNTVNFPMLIRKAPEPEDIIWQNLSYSGKNKILRRLVSALICTVLLGVCFGALMGLFQVQIEIREGGHENLQQRLLAFAGSFAVLIINKLFQIMMRRLSEIEKHTSHTDHFLAICLKLAVLLFLNSAVTMLLAHLTLQWIEGEYAIKHDQSKTTSDNIWGQGGLLEDLWPFFWSASYVPHILSFLDPWYIIRRVKRKLAAKQAEKCKMIQAEAHKLFEGSSFDLAQKYANIIKSLWLTAFYTPVFPLGVPIMLSGLIVMYWNEKNILLRRAAHPPQLGARIGQIIIGAVEITPLIYSIGSLIFSFYATRFNVVVDFYIIQHALSIGLSAVYLILPRNSINRFIFRVVKRDEEDVPYDQGRLEFVSDYDIANPITHRKEINNFLNVIKEKRPERFKSFAVKQKAHDEQELDEADMIIANNDYLAPDGNDGNENDGDTSKKIFPSIKGFPNDSYIDQMDAQIDTDTLRTVNSLPQTRVVNQNIIESHGFDSMQLNSATKTPPISPNAQEQQSLLKFKDKNDN